MCVKSQEGFSLLHIINRSLWLSRISEITLFMPTLYEYGCCCVVVSCTLPPLTSVPTVERDSSKLCPHQRHYEKGGGVQERGFGRSQDPSRGTQATRSRGALPPQKDSVQLEFLSFVSPTRRAERKQVLPPWGEARKTETVKRLISENFVL